MPHGIKVATLRDDGEVEEVFTSAMLARSEDPVLLFVAQSSSSKKVKRTSQPARRCKLTEVENNPILKSCEEEQRRPAPTQLEHVPRRWAARDPPARSHGAESGEKDRRVQR